VVPPVAGHGTHWTAKGTASLNTENTGPLPLDDITVLDLSRDIPGAWCTRLLAALGARVILVEPPTGSPLRARAPFKDDLPGVETSGVFLYLAGAKQSVTLDLATPSGRALLAGLTAGADVLVEDFPPGTLAGWGLDHEALQTHRPGMITCAITPFGQDGPYRAYLLTEIVAEALGGLMETIGLPEREPLKIGGSPALFNAGGAAFTAIMAAIWQRDTTGEGQSIDISIQETAAFTQIHSSILAAFHDEPSPRRPNTMIEAKDGWVSLGLEMGVAADIWPQICALIGRPDLADDPRFSTTAHRRENREALNQIMADWVCGQSKEAIYHQLQAMRTIAGFVATVEDLYANVQLRSRDYFTEIDHPVAGSAGYPGLPFRVGDAPATTERAPLLGEHTRAILTDTLQMTADDIVRLRERGVI
jgi:crotonobetainyl-CoA:carnitine CoA-transferase CaiB-like acyl-CoA transferase